MKGYRNIVMVYWPTLLVSSFLGYMGIRAESDLLGLSTLIGAIVINSFGIAMARGYNKKVAPEQ